MPTGHQVPRECHWDVGYGGDMMGMQDAARMEGVVAVGMEMGMETHDVSVSVEDATRM